MCSNRKNTLNLTITSNICSILQEQPPHRWRSHLPYPLFLKFHRTKAPRTTVSTIPINTLKPTRVHSSLLLQILSLLTRYPLFAILVFSRLHHLIPKMKNILSLSVLAGLASAYSGDLTYYTAGLGSCGVSSTDSDAIVALSLPMVCLFRSRFSLPRTAFLDFQAIVRERDTPNTSPTCLVTRDFTSEKERLTRKSA